LLLRASGQSQNTDYDLGAVLGGGEEDGVVPQGRLLVEFAEAVLAEESERLDRARATLSAAIGLEGLVDSAGVVGLFNAIDRVADATGIPLEAEKSAASEDFRAALGLDRFSVTARD
jgi:hypothetical protein